MKVLGVTGMPGSGKSIFLDTAIEKSAIVVSMGDIIREKAKERGEDTGTTARKIREEFGQYIEWDFHKALAKARGKAKPEHLRIASLCVYCILKKEYCN